ncbi:hypothetical protein [Bosea sp. (in: a-proteobacteria)]|uniref:Pam3-gp28 family putative phage holin n=1 Tax=Bosea sp. (in: a-proteobacteria) TaxID=1871050 RepID=UPI00086C8844|nr:hypothetical protein [Bosea sp. (in: a-proteobacteria)]MBN9440496.1 hypothetical protein [Bosea sp. (in: a-proteobacteria)]ODT55529.1 MAG: hypothetical protein ABS59_03325 [Methylobacterium sp. SCN 67-24]
MPIDWSVFARQLALVFVPMLVARGIVPAYLAGPLVDLASYLLGTVVVGWVIWLGQRREKPAVKIEETAKLREVAQIKVNDPRIARAVPSLKVTP